MGIEEEAISCKIASCAVKTVDKNVLTIHCKMLFVFVVYVNHENIFTSKISRFTIVHAFIC